jgi:REP element-mobilizing transposase RayT
MIDRATRAFLDQFFQRTIIQERARLIGLAILQTHVHLLVRTPPRFDLPHLVQLLRGESSYAASRHHGNVLGLRWNKAHAVTTVSPIALPVATAYLAKQNRRHPTEVVTG